MLFCIIGKSSTGKDTIYKELLRDPKLNLKNIVSYTTRPQRANEKDGEEYHFCSQKQKEDLLDSGKVIEIRTYSTCYGPWDYFTVDDGALDIEKEDYLIIATLESYKKIKDYYGAKKVLPIYIEVEDGVRLQRALDREKGQEHPKYSEMCRRFLADADDFSEEKLKEAGVENIFVNDDIEDTVLKIGEFIIGN